MPPQAQPLPESWLVRMRIAFTARKRKAQRECARATGYSESAISKLVNEGRGSLELAIAVGEWLQIGPPVVRVDGPLQAELLSLAGRMREGDLDALVHIARRMASNLDDDS